jgi:hypothetical protein
MGFVTAVGELSGSQGLKRVCFPKGVTARQSVSVVKASLEKHPKFRRYTAVALVNVALSAAYPCKK